MEAYAVIETGGKQYRVQQGDVLDVELLSAEEGASVEFETLAVSDGKETERRSAEIAGSNTSDDGPNKRQHGNAG